MATRTTLVYETTTCTRCGGGGRYSYCQRFGDTCFKCGGAGKVRSAAGVKAAAAVRAFREAHFSVRVEDLQPGDRYYQNGRVVTVDRVTTIGGGRYGKRAADGELVWRDYVTVYPTQAELGSYGYLQGTTVVRAVSGDDWQRVVAFARTLKKGVTVKVTGGEQHYGE